MAKVTVSEERYGAVEQGLDALVGIATAMNCRATRVEVDDVLNQVRAVEGDDWGDPTFIEVYREMVEALKRRPITHLARLAIRAVSKKAVVNRVRLRRWIAAHPEIVQLPVERPVFVVGFPRTGTTVLQNLLSLHPSRRSLSFWEMQDPVPASADPQEDRRVRIAKAERILWFAHRFAPEQSDIHQIRATTPEEDWAIMAHTFAVLNYDFQGGLKEFGDYLMGRDMAWAYREFKEMLQVLLHHHPAEGVVSKCPEHLWFLDALLEVFPDACVVWTHRDPYPTLASYCSLISLSRRTYYGRIDPHALGAYMTERFAQGVERAMAVRDKVGDDRFFDANFRQTVEDPAGQVREICEHFDLPWEHGTPGSTDESVARWLAGDRSDKRGRHVYDGARYGLDPDEVRARFAPYIQRFGIDCS